MNFDYKSNSDLVGLNLYSNYAAKLFANTIATIAPKVKISNEKILSRFNQIISKQYLFSINYNLAYELSLNGRMVLGLIKPKTEPTVVLISPANLDLDMDNSLTGLSGIIKSINSSTVMMINKKTNRSGKYKYTFKLEWQDEKKEYCHEFTQPHNILPFVLVNNNPIGEDDFSNVDKKILEDYVAHLALLKTDSETAKGITHIYRRDSNLSKPDLNDIESIIKNPTKAIYVNTSTWSLLTNNGLQIQQGISNYQSLLEKLKFYDNKIRDLAFLPRSTLDAGTKNIHNAEASSINSNSEDYIEIKANLIECAWTNFIENVFIDYLKENEPKIIGSVDLDSLEVDVEIAGSTKYLKNKANEYIQNQQGVLVNPNQMNITPNSTKGGAKDNEDTK